MNALEAEQLRTEINRVICLALDARSEGQFAAMERLMEQAVATAEQLGELKQLVRTRFWLAHSRRRQGQYQKAVPIYLWLIDVATDPASQDQFADNYSQWILARSFSEFIMCGQALPEMPTAQLLRVVDDGLAWVAAIGKPEWTAGLRLRRGVLLYRQGDLVGARREMESSLAICRRYPDGPGSSLVDHLTELAALLNEASVGEYAEAIPLAEEILNDADVYSRHIGHLVLADAYLGLKDYDRALGSAQLALAAAKAMESPSYQSDAYERLSHIHLAAGRLTEATEATSQDYAWARAHTRASSMYAALARGAKTRLLQARQAACLPLEKGDLSADLPPDADRSLAWRRLDSSRRFIGRARVIGTRLDKASEVHIRQDWLDKFEREADALAALLDSEKENERG